MTYKVGLAHAVVCGFCQQAMRQDNSPKRGEMQPGVSLVIRCPNQYCEQHDVPLIYPLPMLELQKAEVA